MLKRKDSSMTEKMAKEKEMGNVPNFSKQVPNLRFHDFSEEWEMKKLGAVMDFKVTNSFSRDNLNYETGSVKNIHYGDIHTRFQTLFDITKEKVPYINEEISIVRISEDFYCKEGDILFADASEDLNDVGKSIEILNLNNEKILSGLHTILARPKANYFKKGFLGYLLKSDNVRFQIKKEAQGSKVLSISSGRISKVELIFPILEEQEKITKLLSLVDDRIAVSIKIIQQLETSMQNLRERLFTQKMRFKDSFGKSFANWETKKLGDIATRITDKNKEDNKNVLTISAQHGLISQLDFFNKSVSAKDITGYFLLKKNNFAYNKSYSNGYPMGAIKRLKHYEKGVVSTLYICFNFNSDRDLDFMEHLFEAGIQNSELEKIAQEGARNHGLLNIGLADFFNIELTIPSLDEQKCIGKFLYKLQEKIELEKQLLLKYEKQKRYLLQNLFI
jgi:type I restriction enzyme S subunit